MPIETDAVVRELLGFQRIAVVGCSRDPAKAAHSVPAYMRERGYEVVPVNPYAEEILGRKAYDSILDVEEDVELVNVFRPSSEAGTVIDDVIERAETRGDVKAVWLQLGIYDDEAAERAEAAVLQVVQDRCIKVEHQRLVR